MSDQTPAPATAEDVEGMRAELAELKARMAALDVVVVGAAADRMAATIAVHLLTFEGMLRDLSLGVARLTDRVDAVYDRIGMTRSEVGKLAEVRSLPVTAPMTARLGTDVPPARADTADSDDAVALAGERAV